jgi:hypothetical protein
VFLEKEKARPLKKSLAAEKDLLADPDLDADKNTNKGHGQGKSKRKKKKRFYRKAQDSKVFIFIFIYWFPFIACSHSYPSLLQATGGAKEQYPPHQQNVKQL